MNVFADLEGVLRRTGDGRRHVIGASAMGAVSDSPPPDPAKVKQVHALLNQAAYEYELEPFTQALAILETLEDARLDAPPAVDGDDDDGDHGLEGPLKQNDFASFVGQTVDDEETWPAYRRLAVNLHKLHLEGQSLERVLAQLLAVAIRSKDDVARDATVALIPSTVTWDILAFNLACLYAVLGDKDRQLPMMRTALGLGKDTDEFRDDPDFEKFLEDPDFVAVLEAAEASSGAVDSDDEDDSDEDDSDEDDSDDDSDEDDSDEDDPDDDD